jgi:carboxymethylenebutenolidase
VLLCGLLAACTGSGGLSEADRAELDAMATEHAHDSPVSTPAATTPPALPVRTETVTYATVDGRPVQGFLARPAGVKGPLPGLIVIHEWWGLNDNVRDETKRLAAEGYVALAVDLYGGQVADTPPAALKLSMALSREPAPAEDNLRQAYRWLEQEAKAPRIGTIGWCMGGRWSLRTALLLPEQVDATVIYYGSVKAEEAELAALKMPVYGFFAGKDRIVPLPTVESFEATMRRLGKDIQVKVYPDADHAFANPSGGVYNAEAAEDSWRLTIAFLKQHLHE